MTDKQLIETLKNIKEYCGGCDCSYCKFNTKDEINGTKCQIQQLLTELNFHCVDCWDIEKIEGIING